MEPSQEELKAQSSSEKKDGLARSGFTITAALMSLVVGVFNLVLGGMMIAGPFFLEKVSIIESLVPGQQIPPSLLHLVGVSSVILGAIYIVAGLLLYSVRFWVRGAYLGIVVSILGTLIGGISVTLTPGVGAAVMVINILIITMIGAEAWEEKLIRIA